MTLIDSRPLRIIPADSDQRQADRTTRARRFDYAALVRRTTRSPRPPVCSSEAADAAQADYVAGTAGGSNRAAHERSSDDAQPRDDAQARDSSADTEVATADEGARASAAALAAHDALLQRLPAATMPAVDALFRTQGHFLELARSLAREVAAFCADPAIGEAGNWEVRMALDERILPHTTLYLSLSRFWLSLRFDTRGIETRQLLFDHSAMLERELAALLNAWGTPRDIELTVW
ncbi:type III secretion system protein SctP [Paraburkholderia phenoliruptrix]|uniref:type III secretion system protein SctP n=1 Tax=Paraburkholderia phenoliruptrix TaxID=252970 RepID=UPI001C6F274D|nr:type III secretion system protein SctP [Paraburkholderia phenoliruptrix]MBW9102111.1 type III secretion system protein SctP [Paraburkholderia phenoliruptrix]MBW9131222.1 type III secretion system protein SctP [Paraburkholderia ginsengiterrae]